MRLLAPLLNLDKEDRTSYRAVLKRTQGLNHCINVDGVGFDPDAVWYERGKEQVLRNDYFYSRWLRAKQRRSYL
jgi:hypothetical protein